jgi:putative membrane protein
MKIILAAILLALIALLHFCFLLLEMFFWDKPLGLRTFGIKPGFAKASRTLAANQGLYNGYLAAGLVWGPSPGMNGDSIKIFVLICVIVAGVFGGLAANRRIFFIQAFPAIIALSLIFLAGNQKMEALSP